MKAYLLMFYWSIPCSDWCDGEQCASPVSLHTTKAEAEAEAKKKIAENPSKYGWNCRFKIEEMEIDLSMS